MGEAPKILAQLEQSSERLREQEQWYLDASSGELKQEVDPSEDQKVRYQPVRVARQTFD